MSAVEIADGRARVRFDRFDPSAYDRFVRAKQLPEKTIAFDEETGHYTVETAERFASILDPSIALPSPLAGDLSGHLFDYQRFIVNHAIEAKRYAIWADTGLGKTAMFLEWAQQVQAITGGGVLILSPLQVIPQTSAERRRFYGHGIRMLTSRAELVEWCKEPQGIAITNYEKLIKGELPELRRLAGLVLDESSMLKSGGGTIKWNLIHLSRGIEYKLSCTATPAPNDTMEYASQAAFLEKLRTEADILWTYFTRDKQGNWRVKPHAEKAFYEFMSSWSVYIRDPVVYGFEDILSTLPPPEYHEEDVAVTAEQRSEADEILVGSGRGLFDDTLGMRERQKLAQIARGFIYEKTKKGSKLARRISAHKPERVAEIVLDSLKAKQPTLVWTVFDEETEILREALGDVDGLESVSGDDSDTAKIDAIERFRSGESPALISKASLIGFGLNFQRCRSMVFSGIDDSYERLYQAVRRAYRFGQTETVHVHLPVVPELEGVIYQNLMSKQRQFEADVEKMERCYVQALDGELG